MDHERFNVRAYGILLRDDCVLISHELVAGRIIAKFPGGGVEFGEGPKQTVEREFMEEAQAQVRVTAHFYTTDFYLPSAFDPRDQVLSIYYMVASDAQLGLPMGSSPPSDADVREHHQLLCWHPLSQLTASALTLPADKVVARMLTRYGAH